MTFKNIMEKFVDCMYLWCSTITGRALLFHALWTKWCVSFGSIPYLSASFKRNLTEAKSWNARLDELQLWNCFSYYPAVHSWEYFRGKRGKYIGKDKIMASW
jgi:hypothetical protein